MLDRVFTAAETRTLRAYYYALADHTSALKYEGNYVAQADIQGLVTEIERLHQDFPGAFPPFNPTVYSSTVKRLLRKPKTTRCFKVYELLSHAGSLVYRIKAYLDDGASQPVTQARLFPFIRDAEVRRIVERDYSEIERAFVAQCWKSVIVLSGSAIEATLVDLLLQNQQGAKAASQAPNEADLLKWDLGQLIDVAVELQLVGPGVARLSHPVRQYRNLVHPGNEIRTKMQFGRGEARIAIEVLNMLHRDISGSVTQATSPPTI